MRFLILAVLLSNVPPVFAASCEGLATLAVPDTEVTSAKLVGAGELVLAGGRGGDGAAFKNLPAFCRVQATLRPSKDSDIKVEIWLPAAEWNGNFQAATSGGASAALQGEINFAGLAAVLRAGYATGATDLGHEGATLNFALAHPERLIDFGYRAFREMTVKAKAITAAFYGKNPGHALPVRSGSARVQREPEHRLPHGGADRRSAEDLFARDQSTDQSSDFPRPGAGQRTRVG